MHREVELEVLFLRLEQDFVHRPGVGLERRFLSVPLRQLRLRGHGKLAQVVLRLGRRRAPAVTEQPAGEEPAAPLGLGHRLGIERIGVGIEGPRVRLGRDGDRLNGSRETGSGSGVTPGDWGLGTGDSGSGSGAASGSGSTTSAVMVTFVPHPVGSSSTVPLAFSPSQATVVSGSARVILISPNSPRWRSRPSTSLSSVQSSGGDLTSVLLTLRFGIEDRFARRRWTPPPERFGAVLARFAAVIGDDLREALGPRLPRDHSRQTQAPEVAAGAMASMRAPRVLDLGCGAGDSVELFRRLDPGVEWIGLDVQDSAEVRMRTRTDAEFHTFNGEHIPFEEGRFDLVYSAQVLEHVQRPGPLLAEVSRVLRPGGRLAGSTSQLEPFHSRSTFGYTPYGLTLLLEDGGLEVLELRPSIDAVTLILRRGLGGPRWFDRWWARESPLNRVIDVFGRAARLDAPSRNAAKLLFCGQFCFVARRPDAG